MSDRIRLLDGGIFLQDFSRVASKAEALAAIAEARAAIEKLPKGDVLVLTDVTDAAFDQEIVDAIRSLADHHRPWVKASAVVGLSAIQRVIYRVVVTLTRREIHVCNTRDEALAYLNARATPAAASRRTP